MKKVLPKLFIVLMIVGIVLSAVSFSDAIKVMKDDIKDFNSMDIDEFDNKTLVKGKITCAYDQVATLTTTNSKYGVTTGKTKTNYYLIETRGLDEEGMALENSMYILYATPNKDEITKLDDLVDALYDADESGDYGTLEDLGLEINGKVKSIEDDELTEYRDEYLTDMGHSADEIDEYTIDMVIQRFDYDGSQIIMFAGIGIFAVGLIGLLVVIIPRKKKDEEEY